MCYDDEKDKYLDEDHHADLREEIGEIDELFGDMEEFIKDNDFGMHPNKPSDNFGWDENYGINDDYGIIFDLLNRKLQRKSK